MQSDRNPWKNFALDTYEAHMQSENVGQLQALNQIMKEQLNAYHVKSAAILGIAGGNGLEHIGQSNLEQIYGIDINPDYLQAVNERYSDLGARLLLQEADLTDPSYSLPNAQLIIANLMLEYVGISHFLTLLKKGDFLYVSCVIQQQEHIQFVSDSPYLSSFDGISSLHRDISSEELVAAMQNAHFILEKEKQYPLPNQKVFLRLDFKKVSSKDAP